MKRYRWNYKKCVRNLCTLALRVLAVLAFLAFCSIGPVSWYGI